MSNRYVMEKINKPFYTWDFKVVDNKTDFVICLCKSEEDAELIVGTLNKAWKDIEDADMAYEMGG